MLLSTSTVKHDLLIFFTLIFIVQGALISSEVELITHLLSNHSKYARPVKNVSETVKVEFGAEIVQIQEIMMPVQTLKATFWIRMRWKNWLMTWRPEEFHGTKSILLDANLIWVPDIVLYNRFNQQEKDEEYENIFLKTPVRLNYDGTSYWNAPATVVSTCQLDVSDFPFDAQVCLLKFGPWNSDSSQVNVFADAFPLTTKNYVENSEWKLLHSSKKKNLKKYACCANEYADVTITVKVRRKPLFYLFNFVVPYAVLIFCLWVGYFVPPQSGERIALSLTILLAFSILIQTASIYLPRSAELSSLSVFYFIILNQVALSALITCLIVNVFYTSEWCHHAHMPLWVEKIFLYRLESIFQKIGLLSTSFWRSQNYKAESFSSKSNFISKEVKFNEEDLDNIKTVTSVVSACESVLNNVENNEQVSAIEHGSTTFVSKRGYLAYSSNSDNGNNSEKEAKEVMCTSNIAAKNSVEQKNMQWILALLKNINKRTCVDLTAREMGVKWKRLAVVLDRLSFLFFSLFTVFVLLAFLVIKPLLGEHSHN